jgi:hypothetical protein
MIFLGRCGGAFKGRFFKLNPEIVYAPRKKQNASSKGITKNSVY